MYSADEEMKEEKGKEEKRRMLDTDAGIEFRKSG